MRNIVKIDGGLGNQMFQYSFALCLKEKGYDVEIDTTYYDKGINPYMLKYFNISIPVTSSKNRIIIYKIISVFLRKIFSKSFEFYKVGYWQSVKCLPDKNILHKEFNLKITPSSYCLEVLKKIKCFNSVSVHIRRGDYLSKINSKIYNNLNMDYYNNYLL